MNDWCCWWYQCSILKYVDDMNVYSINNTYMTDMRMCVHVCVVWGARGARRCPLCVVCVALVLCGGMRSVCVVAGVWCAVCVCVVCVVRVACALCVHGVCCRPAWCGARLVCEWRARALCWLWCALRAVVLVGVSCGVVCVVCVCVPCCVWRVSVLCVASVLCTRFVCLCVCGVCIRHLLQTQDWRQHVAEDVQTPSAQIPGAPHVRTLVASLDATCQRGAVLPMRCQLFEALAWCGRCTPDQRWCLARWYTEEAYRNSVGVV
jgi:hypothetical protein